MKKGVFLIMVCISFLGLFSSCKTDADKDKLSKKEKEKQRINDIANPTSDIPAYEGFKDVSYDSEVENKRGHAAVRLDFKDTAICVVNGGPDVFAMFADYVVDGDKILFDFKRSIELNKTITLHELKEAFKIELQNYKETRGLNETEEEYQKRLERVEKMIKKEIEDLIAGKHDALFTKYTTKLHKQAEELEKINPIKGTLSSDKSKIVLEKYVVIDLYLETGERSEYENLECVKR